MTPSRTFTQVWASFHPSISFSAAASPPASPDTSQFSSNESGHKKLIVVDEAQRIYDPEASGSRELWDCLKHGAVIDSKVVFLLRQRMAVTLQQLLELQQLHPISLDQIKPYI